MLSQPSNYNTPHLPSLPSHFHLGANCVQCHDELSYLHLDAVWFLFAVGGEDFGVLKFACTANNCFY